MKRDKYLQIRCTEEEKHLFDSIAKKRRKNYCIIYESVI